LLHWGRRGREDRKAEERDREGHGEKVRGGEKKRGEAMGPHFLVQVYARGSE